MKYRLVDILCCPRCSEPLHLHPFVESEDPAAAGIAEKIATPRCTRNCALHGLDLAAISRTDAEDTRMREIDCAACYRKEVDEGLLACRCGGMYAIFNSVPRFIGDHTEPGGEFHAKYEAVIREASGGGEVAPADGNRTQESATIRKSFNSEWDMFDHEKDRAWGWNLDERRDSVLTDLDVSRESMDGKLLLDAGCGAGTLTSKISEFGTEVVGIDLTVGALKGEAKKREIAPRSSSFVHFVQGNLITPPFRKESFDIIYSYGVLHHTSSTRRAFASVAPLARSGGRFFVWLYSKRVLPVTLFFWHGRMLTRHLPPWLSLLYCKTLSPFYKIFTDSLTALNICKFRKRSLREITIDVYDAFTPRWNHTHSENEIVGWYREEGFGKTGVTSKARQGTGVYGIKD